MATPGRETITPVDLCYGGATLLSLLQLRPRTKLGLSMALFALVIVLVDWVETRTLLVGMADLRDRVTTYVLSVVILVTWLGLITRPLTALASYFGLLAGFFFLQAVRDAAVLTLSPIVLFRRGYVNLVAVYLVFGAAVNAIDRYQTGLVVLAFGVYAVRKAFTLRNRRRRRSS